MSIKEFWNKNIINKNLFGTISQGFYNLVDYDVDFFSGHLIHEYKNRKDTDINYHFDNYKIKKTNNSIIINCEKNDKRFNLKKKIEICFKDNSLNLEVELKKIMPRALRLFYITINPECFSKKSLFYATKNGGKYLEYFSLNNIPDFDHGERVSNIVSAKNCLGATDGKLLIGDKDKYLEIELDRTRSAIVPMVQYKKIKNKFLFRVFFSAGETDDTLKKSFKNINSKVSIKIIKNNNNFKLQKNK